MLYNDLLMRISLYLARILNAYSILIWIRIIFSWIYPNPGRNNFIYWMGRLVDPYLGVFKGKKSTVGSLDFSPIFAIGVIYVFQGIFQYYGVTGTLTLQSVLYLFISALWSYGLSVYFWVLFIALVFRTIAAFSTRSNRFAYSPVSRASDSVTDFVRQMAGRRLLSERTVCIISLILVIVFYFITRYLVGWLLSLVLRIPL